MLYVITGERTAQHLAPDEAELLALFRAAPLAVKAAAVGALQGGTGKPSGGVVVTGSNNRTAGRNYNEKT